MTQAAVNLTLTKLADAALALASVRSWAWITLSDLCAQAEVSLADCALARITKAHVAANLDTMLDQAMLHDASNLEPSQGVRDSLFDVLMARFDAMETNRAAWVSILGGEAGDPLARLARGARRARSGAWALEASGVTSSNIKGAGRALGLARRLRLVEAAWQNDGPDLAKTMARLDQELRQGEAWVERAQDISAMMAGFNFKAAKSSASQDVAVD